MENNINMKFLISAITLILTISLFSCKDDDSLIGDGFIQNKIGVKYDTIDVSLKTLPYSNITEIGNQVSQCLVGEYVDPVFGRHQAQSMFDFVPQSNQFSFGNSPINGKLTLELKYNGYFYGLDTTNDIHLKVYKLNKTLNDTNLITVADLNASDYYNSSDLIGEINYKPDSVGEILSIDLSDELAQDFLDNRDSLSNDTSFQNFFKGIIITGDKGSGTGRILSFYLNDYSTRLHLTFNNDSTNDLAFSFLTGSSSENIGTHRYNYFLHHYNEGSINSYMNSDTTFKDNIPYAFIQSIRGLDILVSGNFENSPWFGDPKHNVINKAFLSLEATSELESTPDTQSLKPPGSLVITEISDSASVPIDGNLSTAIVDYLSSSGLESPQVIDTSSNIYEFKLSGFIHAKNTSNKSNFNIWVRSANSTISANRAVFYSSNFADAKKRPKLIVAYTELKN